MVAFEQSGKWLSYERSTLLGVEGSLLPFQHLPVDVRRPVSEA